ncbi:MAG: hypothetical protein ABIR70_02745 [Bryobacteraceae bacterium]
MSRIPSAYRDPRRKIPRQRFDAVHDHAVNRNDKPALFFQVIQELLTNGALAALVQASFSTMPVKNAGYFGYRKLGRVNAVSGVGELSNSV